MCHVAFAMGAGSIAAGCRRNRGVRFIVHVSMRQALSCMKILPPCAYHDLGPASVDVHRVVHVAGIMWVDDSFAPVAGSIAACCRHDCGICPQAVCYMRHAPGFAVVGL